MKINYFVGVSETEAECHVYMRIKIKTGISVFPIATYDDIESAHLKIKQLDEATNALRVTIPMEYRQDHSAPNRRRK